MLAPWLVILFRVLHIVVGAFWVGAVLFFARFVFPSALALGPVAAPFMDQLGRVRRVPRALVASGITTIVTGFVLYWHDSAGSPGVWAASSMGRVFGFGAVLSLVALTIGLTVNRPSMLKLSAISIAIHGQGGKPTEEQSAEMKRLQGLISMGFRSVAALLVMATIAMAAARYVP